MDDSGIRGTVYLWRGQWNSTYVVSSILRWSLRGTNARDLNDDSGFQADAYSRCSMHGEYQPSFYTVIFFNNTI